jgi:general stress protein 26
MTKDFIYRFIRQHKFGVLSTVSTGNIPQSAYIGFAVTPDLQIIFDTVSDSRKYKNLLLNPYVSFVIGWDNEQTIQYKGIAKIPNTKELEKLLLTYFAVFPEGRNRRNNCKNIAYVYIEPTWIRHSDFNEITRKVEEIEF